jgi:8-oxo-dGTP pyrophosphatase MutT (NUDIX family)
VEHRRITTDELVALTRARLAAHPRRVVPPGPLVRAAVLIPIVDHAGEPYLVFAKRTEHVGSHKGQIAFPGGVLGRYDASELDAALRECEEEVALPREVVDVLGALDDAETFATQFVITPYVGLVREAVAWQPDGMEIEKVIEVPYVELANRDAFRVEQWERDGIVRPVHFFDWDGEMIWGATARILRQYLDVLDWAR